MLFAFHRFLLTVLVIFHYILNIYSPLAVESVHDTLMEQAKAQEETMLSNQEELKETLEKGFNQKLSRVTDEVRCIRTCSSQQQQQQVSFSRKQDLKQDRNGYFSFSSIILVL